MKKSYKERKKWWTKENWRTTSDSADGGKGQWLDKKQEQNEWLWILIKEYWNNKWCKEKAVEISKCKDQFGILDKSTLWKIFNGADIMIRG